jgi:hypothetical protein
MDLKIIFETGKKAFKEAIHDKSSLVVFIQLDPGELRGL